MKSLHPVSLALGTLVALPAMAASPLPDETISSVPTATGASTQTDANIDRAVLLPTAMTQPRGTVTYNNYELVLHGVTVGVTDRLQLSLTVLPAFAEGLPLVFVGAGKLQLVSTGRFHLAVQGSAGYDVENVFGTDRYPAPSKLLAGAGLLGTFCVGDDCATMLSASATLGLAHHGNETDAVLLYGVSAVQRLSTHTKALLEVASGRLRASDNSYDSARGWQQYGGLLVSYGVRFHHANVAGDVGFLKPILMKDTDAPAFRILGLPFVNISYRWQ